MVVPVEAVVGFVPLWVCSSCDCDCSSWTTMQIEHFGFIAVVVAFEFVAAVAGIVALWDCSRCGGGCSTLRLYMNTLGL